MIAIPASELLMRQIEEAARSANLTPAQWASSVVADALRGQGYVVPEFGRGLANRRVEAIMNLKEARGRESLAKHLALQSSQSVEEVRKALACAGFDEASARASDVTRSYQRVRGTG